MTLDELDVLLVEDNPGDARLIEEMLRGAKDLLHRVELGASSPARARVHHERDLAAGIARLSEADIDVVLLDLDLPDSTGLDTVVSVVDETAFTPVVVLTGLDDRDHGIMAIQSGAQDYLVKDEVTGELLVHSIQHALEQTNHERERVRHREQLEALVRLNRISHDITHDVITMSTREDLERAVCERLVESDGYRFAWIGEVTRPTRQLTPRVSAGVEDGYFEDVTLSVGAGPAGEGPEARAVRTQEVQIVHGDQTDLAVESWREEASARGYRSGASIPIVHETILYGVLSVYASSPTAFSKPEAEILSRIGEVIGHAITAIVRKEALVSDTVLELEFRTEGFAEELVVLAATRGGSIDFQNFIRTDDALLAYGRTSGIPREDFQDVAERATDIDDLRIHSSGPDAYEFELVIGSINALVTAVATHGGHLSTASIDSGECRFVVEFPPGRDKKQLVELVEDHCAGASPHAQRVVQRQDSTVSNFPAVFRDRLTEKQRTALETAFFSGFFEWPRTSTGQEIADRLGITPATFTEHLRSAERKFFESLFETETGADPVTSSVWTPLESDEPSR